MTVYEDYDYLKSLSLYLNLPIEVHYTAFLQNLFCARIVCHNMNQNCITQHLKFFYRWGSEMLLSTAFNEYFNEPQNASA